MCLRPGGDIPENIVLRSAYIAKLDERREKKNCSDLLNVKKVKTRA